MGRTFITKQKHSGNIGPEERDALPWDLDAAVVRLWLRSWLWLWVCSVWGILLLFGLI